jgi:hypothetical protein
VHGRLAKQRRREIVTTELTDPGNSVKDTLAKLDAERQNVSRELDAVTDKLGEAVIREDEAAIQALEIELDTLGARHSGLSAEITELQRSLASADAREQRRIRAAARIRQELALARVELYDGWATQLEHRARMTELRQELDRLERSTPVQTSRLEALEQRLATEPDQLDLTVRELGDSRDVARLRDAAGHYRRLSNEAQASTREPNPAPASPPATAEHDAEQASQPVQPEARPAVERETSEQNYIAAEEELLRALKNTISERGDPLGVGQDVEGELASIESRRGQQMSQDGKAGESEQASSRDEDSDQSRWRRLGFGRSR